jgi:O-antigen/teichoic acid export membrane protein
MAAVAVVWVLAGYWLIVLVFGSDYAGAYRSSVLLVLSVIPLSMGMPTARALMILAKVQWNLWCALFQLAVNVGVCFWLIPEYQAEGAAAAILISQTCASALKILVGRGITRRALEGSPPTAEVR